jgi:hypothetical protein
MKNNLGKIPPLGLEDESEKEIEVIDPETVKGDED